MKCAVIGCDRDAVTRGWCNRHYSRVLKYGDPLVTMKTPPGEIAKWVEAHKDYTGDDCLIYPFGRTHDGYAVWRKTWKGNAIYVHRLMCEYKHGPCPADKEQAAHSCGNGHLGCVNPNHVRWATKKENNDDKKLHGTYQYGEKNPSARLDERKAKLVLALRGGAFTQSEIARIVGSSRRNVSNVQTGVSWGWLNYSPPPKRPFLTDTRFGGFFNAWR